MSKIHYIPLKVKEIVRDEKGNKVIGAFPNWKNTATHIVVDKFSKIHRASAIIVGISKIKVLDIDDNEIFNDILKINSQLAPEYQCKLIVKSDLKGGHFYFNDSENSLDKHLNYPKDGAKIDKIDYQTGNRLIFTWVNNKTKKILVKNADSPDELTPLPDAIATYIVNYDLKHTVEKLKIRDEVVKSDDIVTLNHLAPLIHNILSDVTKPDVKLNSLNTFLHIVTPKEYKKILKSAPSPFGDNGTVVYHPNTFKKGDGTHNYLVSIGYTLMKDESVDVETYMKAINFLNNLMDDPDPTIDAMIKRDIASPEFNYNPNWKTKTLTLTGKDGSTSYKIYQVLDASSETYMLVDEIKQRVMIGKKNAIVGIIHSKMAGGRNIKPSNIAEKCLNVAIVNNPLKPFGLQGNSDEFNIFRRTKVQQVFYQPENFPELAKTTPDVTLRYLTHICGNERKKDLFLGFLKRKLYTHAYSPLVFVLWGVPGSGKNTLTQKILQPLVEGRDVINLTVENLRDKFNSVFKERDFIVLDEVHTLPPGQRKEFINLINSITGKEKIAERRMFSSDIQSFSNEVTFILTTNKPTEITTEANDRRVVVFHSSKTLSEALGMEDNEVMDALEKEKYSFAYYLAQLPMLDYSIYTKNYYWNDGDIDYEEFMTEAKPLGYRIYKSLFTRNYETLLDILFDADITDEEFANMIYKDRGNFVLRVLNSRPDRALIPALGNHPNLALKQENIVQELRALSKEYKDNFYQVEKIEYENSIATGNRKTTYRIDINKLPEKIRNLIPDYVENLENFQKTLDKKEIF